MEHEIGLYDAIREMRELTGKQVPFSMVFMSYDRGRQKSDGVVIVPRAKLRNATPKEQNKNAHYMINFLDIDRNVPRQMYFITLMEFNGKKVKVS